MKIEYDKIADAMYLYLKKAKIYKTVKMQDRLVVDVDRKGNIIGMEVLDVSSQIPQKSIKEFGMKIDMPSFA